MDKNEIIALAESLLRPTCAKFIPVWLESAKKEEIKGLKVLKAIAKHKGQKKFKKENKAEKSVLIDVYNDIKRQTMTSNYSAHFSSLSPSQSHVSDILQYKRLTELKYSQILNPSVPALIEKWLMLNDDVYYKDLLLKFLQGIHSVCKINENLPVTQNQESFKWYSRDEHNRMNPVISKKQNFQPVERRKTNSLSINSTEGDLRSTVYDPKGFREKMAKKMRGSADFMNWVFDKKSSMYQETFASRVNKIPAEKAKPLNLSTVIRVLPS